MWIVITCIAVLLFLSAMYLWCIRGRAGHKGWAGLENWNYAHRGLHDDEKPENSMAAFRAALEAGCGVELDVHLMRDGNLAVIHDSSLKRTAGADVRIEDLVTEDLANHHLASTQECIPQFKDVLDLFNGKAPLIVELKVEKNNYASLCQAVCHMLDQYNGAYCIESFDPRAVAWLRKNRPDIIRGQLSENWMKTKAKMPWIVKFLLTYHLTSIWTHPDFIAYKYCDRKTFGTGLCRKLWKVHGVSWTLKTREEYDIAVQDGWIPIFENFRL
jgi:glycerophosphoryl diester phosphodiesterase